MGRRPRAPQTLPSAQPSKGSPSKAVSQTPKTRDSILEMARQAFGIDRVIDRLRVESGARLPGWLGKLAALFGLLSEGPSDGTVEITGDDLRLRGSVFSQEERTSFADRVRAALPDLDVIDELEVVEDPAAEKVQQRLDYLLAGKIVEFRTNSAELTENGRRILDPLVGPLRAASGYRVEISGHTDSRGSDQLNLDLSRRRAQAVLDYVVSKGVSSNGFTTEGYGSSRPIADNDTPEGRQRNRRIEFRILEEN